MVRNFFTYHTNRTYSQNSIDSFVIHCDFASTHYNARLKLIITLCVPIERIFLISISTFEIMLTITSLGRCILGDTICMFFDKNLRRDVGGDFLLEDGSPGTSAGLAHDHDHG